MRAVLEHAVNQNGVPSLPHHRAVIGASPPVMRHCALGELRGADGLTVALNPADELSQEPSAAVACAVALAMHSRRVESDQFNNTTMNDIRVADYSRLSR